MDTHREAPPWLGESGVDNGERARGRADTSKETGEVGCRVGLSGEGCDYCTAKRASAQQHAPPGPGDPPPRGLAGGIGPEWSEHLVGGSGHNKDFVVRGLVC